MYRWTGLFAFLLYWPIAILGSEAIRAQEKVDPLANNAAVQNGRVRVIIVTRADIDQDGGGQPLGQSMGYVTSVLGGSGANFTAIGKLPAVAAEVTEEGLEKLREDPNVVLVTRDVPMPPSLLQSVQNVGAVVHFDKGFKGAGINVAVLDTGVDTSHPALKDSVVSEACFSTAQSTIYKIKSLCPGEFWEAVKPGAATNCPHDMDGCEHGTHVAGIIASHGQYQAGVPINGVAPAAGIVAVQVFTLFEDTAQCGGAPKCVLSFTSDQLRALEWVYRNRTGLKIGAINMSLGGGYRDVPCDKTSALTEIIERLRAKGIATVIAAGNNRYLDGMSEPACISSAVSVAALNRTGNLDVTYSNVSKYVTIAAPGTSILSTVFEGKFAEESGTSMAAPHVAGAIALLRQEFPDASVKQLVALLKRKGQDVADPRTDTKLKSLFLANIDPAKSPAEQLAEAEAAEGGVAPAASASEAPGSVNNDTNSYIVRSGGSTESQITSKIEAACIAGGSSLAINCSVKQISEDAYKLELSPGAIDALREQSDEIDKAAQGVGKSLEKILGPGSKVYEDSLSVPQLAQ
jgi:subtilisin family serine protease